MSRPGAPDPEYVVARRVLLHALEVMVDQREALVLVGAQAVYLHTGDTDLAVAPFTTDADLAINPSRLRKEPLIEEAMTGGGFEADPASIGAWRISVEVNGIRRFVAVDFLVPDSLGGAGRRGARIPPHARHVARKARGLEATLVDKDRAEIAALDPFDDRKIEAWVAGPAGLLVAKAFTIGERVGAPDRLSDKDALDVYRLLVAIATDDLAARFRALDADALSRDSARIAVAQLPHLFGSRDAPGCAMAIRAIGPLAGSATVAGSLVELVRDLLRAL